MKRSLLLFLFLVTAASIPAQPVTKTRKYPSLLWEITGNGMKKPSYLIGTMHVSSKLAFNLPDSFYIAIRSAQVVALETNPETWQDDMSKYETGERSPLSYRFNQALSVPEEYLTINTLKFYRYDNKIERSLYSNPSTINNLLYRSYGNESSDFEEDTYLDMYIYQCGKKWGKRVTGVENYGESMKLMAEAYQDAAKDKDRKERSYSDLDEEYSADKLQEAYRTGNLDLLDSINRYNSVSKAFDEKFLYKRNEIQALSIDSILRAGSSLFVGVGAAHLPGERGVIEMLRKMGYRLRPVKMGERASREKEVVDRLRVPVQFRTETAADGLFKVDIPGKFFKFGEDAALDQMQYADMANGSYYMVTRIMTNAWLWNHGPEDVYRKIDSLLYENIPGKIISKTTVTRNGYKGIDLTNRTRRGDLQRYHIFITPFEVLFFKMSGNGDYVKEGVEANKFFGSIQLREYRNGAESATWKNYMPPSGGFSIDLPHEPYIGNDGSWIFDAADRNTGSYFRVIRSDVHNYNFAEEDTFDLALMDESFRASEFIDTLVSRKHTQHQGYPALDCRYRDKDGQLFLTRFIIRGPHYYTLVAHGRQETAAMNQFFSSFAIKPFVYKSSAPQTDTSLYFTVRTPVFPEQKKIRLDMPSYNYPGMDEDEESEDGLLQEGAYRSKVIRNDTTGEKIYVSFSKTGRYYYSSDSSFLTGQRAVYYMGDSSWIVKRRTRTDRPDRMRITETIITDTGSSRTIWNKTFYKDGIRFTLTTQSDTLSGPSQFVKDFYESFTPADTLKGLNPFVKKSDLFFEDFLSKDSLAHKRAVKSIREIRLDSSDLPRLQQLIRSVNWNEKNYLGTKEALISRLGDIKTPAAATYLKDLYLSLDDTVQLQYSALEALLQHKNKFAFSLFREIISNEPPVLDFSIPDYTSYAARGMFTYDPEVEYDDGKFMDELTDSLQLTKTILPDLLPLLNLQDYKSEVMELLKQMVDSNLLKPQDYEIYQSKFLIEAKQELKKQSIAEKKKAIEAAEESKTEKKVTSYYTELAEKDNGNDDLSLYATLLMPFWDTNPAVPPLIGQMLKSNDKRLRYNTLLLLIEKKKPYPDTLLNYFASLDDYRYELYTDLRKANQPALFPDSYNTHLQLGKSALLQSKSYGKPDSLEYVDRLPAEYKGKKGFVYFFKYKEKKDDLNWKLATAGLIPEDPKQFVFTDSVPPANRKWYNHIGVEVSAARKYYFNSFTETKIRESDVIGTLLQKELKKMLYSRRKSGRQFYEEERGRNTGGVDYQD